jgi:hypothetical protein
MPDAKETAPIKEKKPEEVKKQTEEEDSLDAMLNSLQKK